ncbi:MAG: NTE family protein [Bradymonadia bacterium]
MGADLVSDLAKFDGTLREWLGSAPYTLGMSSGYFGFFAHSGVLHALLDAGLAPAAVSGSSAGSLVGGCYASGTPIDGLVARFLALKRGDFWDPGIGAGLLKGDLFRGLLQELTSVARVEACPTRLTVSLFDVARRQTVVISEGDLPATILASCALPFLFHPVRIEGRLYSDGGILDRPGLAGVAVGERVLHHHLSSKSPWRRKDSPALHPPSGPELVALVHDGLPRSGPNKLDMGRRAYDEAKQRTGRALGMRASAVVRSKS